MMRMLILPGFFVAISPKLLMNGAFDGYMRPVKGRFNLYLRFAGEVHYIANKTDQLIK